MKEVRDGSELSLVIAAQARVSQRRKVSRLVGMVVGVGRQKDARWARGVESIPAVRVFKEMKIT